jgi:hypothetical protein
MSFSSFVFLNLVYRIVMVFYRIVMLCFESCSLNRYGVFLQVLFTGTGANEQFVLAWLHAHGVGLRIPELERLSIEVELDGGSLPSLYTDALEATE